jgi:hypothetical protein
MLITGIIIGVGIYLIIAIVCKERFTEYINNTDGIVYRYIGEDLDKNLHVLQSTKDASFIIITNEELEINFHKN